MSRRNKNRPGGAQSKTGVTDAVSVQDAFSNSLFRLGYGSQSPLEATEYPLTRMTGNYALLNSLYRDNWVVQNVVGLMVDDMLREWYKLRGSISPSIWRSWTGWSGKPSCGPGSIRDFAGGGSMAALPD